MPTIYIKFLLSLGRLDKIPRLVPYGHVNVTWNRGLRIRSSGGQAERRFISPIRANSVRITSRQRANK
jgi:hypothetical protein